MSPRQEIPPSRELLSRFQAGDSRAADEIVDRYAQRLLALARVHLSGKLRRRFDADDVVQSAYASFFRAARAERIVWRRAGDLWRMLAAITMHKLHGQVERHQAQRRDVRREAERAMPGSDAVVPFASVDPGPDDLATVAEEIGRLLEARHGMPRQVLELRLEGQSIDQISQAIGRSQRTVRRLLGEARDELVARWQALERSSPP